MNLHWIDWSIMAVFAVALIALAIYVKRFNKSVADFLVAGRSAGRYLLTISGAATILGGVGVVAMMEMYYRAGFCGIWWLMTVTQSIGLLIALSGWVIYRFRETRAMTMPQFFQIRYSRNFRIFCGILAWFSGVLNMGLFPAITARFFIYFCGLPRTYSLFGLEGISTYATIMIVEIAIALLITFLGGMVVVAITDFFQGIFLIVSLLAVLGSLYFLFDWSQLIEALKTAPEKASMLNPFEASKTEGFTPSYFLTRAFLFTYGLGAWLGVQAYSASARNAHEAKMANVLSKWRYTIQAMMLLLIPICVFTLMRHVDFESQAETVRQVADVIENEKIRSQVLAPIALSKILPVGILGLFGAFMVAATISTDDTYLHAWGSIFIQDVILPFRKKGFTPKQHLWLLRLSICLVAVLIFLFSLFFRQNDFIFMFFAMTAAIFTGGAGAAIIGGLYWKRGSTAGAWGGMIVGSGIALGGAILRMVWADHLHPMLMSWFPGSQYLIAHAKEFPLNGVQIALCAALSAAGTYFLLSLWVWLAHRGAAFNMERLLHRGKYAVKGDHKDQVTLPPTGLKALLPGKEYTKFDKFLHVGLMIWTFSWLTLCIGTAIYHHYWGTTQEYWIKFWTVQVYLFVPLGILSTIWFLCGGLRDIKYLFSKLSTAKRNVLDDGRVVGHRSLADEAMDQETSSENSE